MSKPFEFNSVTEMRWIRFRSKIDEVIQMTKGSYSDSKRSEVLLKEAIRQKNGHGISNKIRITDGPLNLQWDGSKFRQKIEMYEVESLLGVDQMPDSIIEVKITIGLVKKEKIVEVLDFIDKISNCKPGYVCYINETNELEFIYRARLNLFNQESICSFIIPILYRQHAYALVMDEVLSSAGGYKSYANTRNEIDPFVICIISNQYALAARGEEITNPHVSPEGVSADFLFKDVEIVSALKLMANAMHMNIPGSEFLGDVSYFKFSMPISFGSTKAQIINILEYAKEPSCVRFSGEHITSEEASPDPVLTDYMSIWKDEGSEQNIDFHNYNEALLTKNYIMRLIVKDCNISIVGKINITSENEIFRINYVETSVSPSQVYSDSQASDSVEEFYNAVCGYLLLSRDMLMFTLKDTLKVYGL